MNIQMLFSSIMRGLFEVSQHLLSHQLTLVDIPHFPRETQLGVGMKRSAYRERDYVFGQRMLILRSAIGLTQARLAALLGVSRQSVADWESGGKYPKAEHLKQFVALAVEHQAFHVGHEAEEIRALWKAAHQKVMLDDVWLSDLLSHVQAAPLPPDVETAPTMAQAVTPARPGRRVDWSHALAVPIFYGREWEQAQLTKWIVEEGCRLVGVVGLGGIGKSALAVSVMHQVAERFEVVIWRSLRDAPSCEALLDGCLQLLAPQPYGHTLVDLEQRLDLLLEYLRGRRALIVLDNLETLLEEGADTGRMRPGYEGYEELLRRAGESEHQSCLLFTSREKPIDLIGLEGSQSPVHLLRLARLESKPCEQLLAAKGVAGTDSERARLIDTYAGNPLALNIVARTIVDLFAGEIARFLDQGEIIFGSIRTLLAEQFGRLSALEQCVLLWLAILREPSSLDDLLALLVTPVSRARLLETVEALHRRSLIERGQTPGSFTLQSVVLEFATARLIAEIGDEIQAGKPIRLIEHSIELAHTREYVRQTQERLIVAPILAHLSSLYRQPASVEQHLLTLLAQFPLAAAYAQGYGPANLVTLLRVQRGHLRSLDLGRLTLRGVYLQGVELQDTNLAGAAIQDSIFTETFDVILAVAISNTGEYWAAASRRGEVRVWTAGHLTLHRVWQAHTNSTWALVFSPDGRALASGSWDGTVKLWDIASGALRWSGWHTSHINSVAFAPDSSMLASTGNDATIRIWAVADGAQLQTLPHPSPVLVVSWSPDGQLVASGDVEGCIRLWELQQSGPASCVQTITGHANWVGGLAFAPDGRTLASASWDGTVKLWEVPSGHLRETLRGHTDWVNRVAWSPDGRTLASAGRDQTIWLWDIEQGSYRAALHEQTPVVWTMAFTPDGQSLLTGCENGTLRVWDVASGQCMRVMEGYTATLNAVDWNPEGTQLVSGGTDTLVTIWDVTGETPPRVLHGHRVVVFGVGWSPDGRWLASSEWDNAIRLWDATSGEHLQVLRHPDDTGNVFYGLAWSPDGQRLASGTFRRGVQVFEMTAQRQPLAGRELSTWIRHVAWSRDGTRLAGGSDDGAVYIWDASDATLLRRLTGHQGAITSVAWSLDGTRLASGSSGSAGGELLVWDPLRGERLHSIAEHPGIVSAVTWGSSSELLVSAGSDGMLRWWNVKDGECVQVREAHRGTVRSLRRSPDGTMIASCGDDGAIMLWNLSSGNHLRTLRRDRPYERLIITGIRGLTEAQKASLIALGAIDEMGDRQSMTGDSAPSIATASLPSDVGQWTSDDRNVAIGLPFQPTSFVGRDDDLATITRRVADPACRLLTLLGPGGIGKTRLALEIATRHTAAFAHGIAFVELASVGTANQIVSAIGDTLQLSFAGQPDPTAHLLGYLRERHMLVVLDNFEHLLDGVDLVASILAHAPQVSILVTSRERLDLQAEWLFEVDGLAYPPEYLPGSVLMQRVPDLDQYSAVQLFVQRATQVQLRLSLSEEALTTVVRICQHVAGMPLAIELAAAGLRTLPLVEIERQIGANLDVLATTLRDVPSRHRSIRAVFDHSWNLLSESERAAFSRLAVFRGGWTVEAAEQVAGATLGVLIVLVDKSLVRKDSAAPRSPIDPGASDASPEPRFIMLEPIREYALEQLLARGEEAMVRHAHATYYLALAEAAAAQWSSPTAEAAVAQLHREYDNLRAGLQWASDTGEGMLGLRLTEALRQFWRSYGYASEGRVWLQQLLRFVDHPTDMTAMAARQRGLHAAAWLASDQHDFAEAARLFEQSGALRRALGETEVETDLLLNAARQARVQGQYQRATMLIEDAMARYHAGGDRGSVDAAGLGQSILELALVVREQGDFARAAELYNECVELHRALGDRERMSLALLGFGDIARDLGDIAKNRTYSEQSLILLRELGIQWAIGFTLNNLALTAYQEGDLTKALGLVNESVALFRAQKADGSLAEVLITLGQVLWAQGEGAAAYTTLTEALHFAWAVGPRLMVAPALEGLASVVVAQRRAELATHLLAAASALRAQMGTPVRPVDQGAVDQALATARSTLGDDVYAAEWAEAQALPLEQILKTIPRA